jgi:hypothetical protein
VYRVSARLYLVRFAVRLCQIGYGDVYPATPAGRMVLVVLVLIMLVQVPVQINLITSYFEPGA